jgi:flagellar M-ring protein FliF
VTALRLIQLAYERENRGRLVAEQIEVAKGGAAQAKPKQAPVSAQAMLDNLRVRLGAMQPGKRNGLLASVLFLAAVAAAFVWYAQRPDWRVLFSGMDSRDAQQVSQELSAAGISYRVSPDGSGVEVPSDMVDKARIEVAAKGMPQSGRLGFELFDKPNWVGSEFDERVNYQRALEGELEHTIGTLGSVRSARVHLVLPQPSLFAAEDKGAKASVVLKLKKSSVDAGEADSIRSLVAGAVDNLSPQDVVLVDADGRVDMKPHSKNMAEGDAERALEAKLVGLLEPLAGRDNVRATVHVNLDQDAEERTDEVYDPTLVATTNMQRSEQTSSSAAKASGVPGTASNTPAAAASGAVQGSAAAAAPGTPPLLQKDAKDALPVYPQGPGPNQTTKQESGTYAVTKHTMHSEITAGRLGRVTAAVVVNDRMTTEGAGKSLHTVWKPRSADELKRMEELTQAAVGYDAKRGDTVVVENMGFSGNTPEPPVPMLDKVTGQAKGFLQTQPNLFRTLVLGACAVLLVLFVLKPVAQQVNTTLREPLVLGAGKQPSGAGVGPGLATVGTGGIGAGQTAGALGEGTAGNEAAPVRRRGKNSAQVIFDSVAEQIKQDPTPSTRLIQSWIATEGSESAG